MLLAADAETGLKAILAVHSTARGPAFGGCRLWTYDSELAALNDYSFTASPEHAADVDRPHQVDLVPGDLEEGVGDEHAGVVVDEVERAKPRHAGVDRRSDRRRVTDIGREADRLSSGCRQHAGGGARGFTIDVRE